MALLDFAASSKDKWFNILIVASFTFSTIRTPTITLKLSKIQFVDDMDDAVPS